MALPRIFAGRKTGLPQSEQMHSAIFGFCLSYKWEKWYHTPVNGWYSILPTLCRFDDNLLPTSTSLEMATLLTIVIPTRHRNDLLTLCLAQLTPEIQGVPAESFRVIVTDDGSDTTAQQLITERFPTVQWVQGPRRGPAANRNHALRLAQSPWVVFTDDDCIPAAGWLRAYSAAIESGEKSGLPTNIYEGRTVCIAGLDSPLLHAPINETGGWLWSCNMAVKRDLLMQLGGFDEEFPHPHMEDVDFRERAYAHGAQICFLPDAVIDHPPRPDNFGAKVAPTHESEFMMFHKMQCGNDFRWLHLRRLANARLRKYWQHRHHPEAIVLVQSLFVELAYIMRHAGTWNKKYRERYRGADSAYLPEAAKRLRYVR